MSGLKKAPSFFSGYKMKETVQKERVKKIKCNNYRNMKRPIIFDETKFSANGKKNLIIVKFFLENFSLNITDLMIKFFMAKKRVVFKEVIVLMNTIPYWQVKEYALIWIAKNENESSFDEPLRRFKNLPI